jgi:hypothetical protein
MTNKIKLGAIVILLSTLTVFTQTKADKPNVSAELKKSAVELLRETPQDVAKLQSPTNRINYLLKLANLLWEFDEDESRSLYKTAMNEIIQDIAEFYAEEPEDWKPRHQMLKFHALNTKLTFRKDLILELLRKDSDLAEYLFKKSFNLPIQTDFAFALDAQNKELQIRIAEAKSKKSNPASVKQDNKSKKSKFDEVFSKLSRVRYENGKSPVSEKERKRINDKLGKEKLTDEEKQNLSADFFTQVPPDQKSAEFFWLENAGNMAKAGEVEFAFEILKQSKLIVPAENKTADNVILSLEFAKVYSLIDPDQSFHILESTIPVLNSALEDYIKVRIFSGTDLDFIENGEINMFAAKQDGEFSKTVFQNLADNEQTIRNLADVDFLRAKNLADKFNRPELKIEMKLLIINNLLEQPHL